MEQNVIIDDRARPAWTPARIARLLMLWGEGLNATRIAEALGDGFSRSAVMGKLIRLGLRRSEADRCAAQAMGGRRAQRRERGPPLVPVPPTPPAPCAVVPRRVRLTELGPCACRWPYADGADTRFCGHPARAGRPYCSAHHAVAYFAVLPPLTLEALEARSTPDAIPSPCRRAR